MFWDCKKRALVWGVPTGQKPVNGTEQPGSVRCAGGEGDKETKRNNNGLYMALQYDWL